MERVSLVTLGVRDLTRARAFYEARRVFVDPDGHPWEVAYNPHWTLGEDGSVSLAR